MNCIVIDDEPIAIEILTDYIKQVSYLNLKNTFRDPVKALEFVQNNNVDLIFLDINLPSLTGIQFLNSMIATPLVIFTTAHSQYAVESYEYDAIDYLLKPIKFERFLSAINKAYKHFQLRNNRKKNVTLSSFEHKHQRVFIKDGNSIHYIKIENIHYVKGAGNYVTFTVNEQEIMSLQTMNQVLKLLPKEIFIRVHKSYIVNVEKIDLIKKDHIIIKGKTVPIGNNFKHSFFNTLKKA